MARKGKEQNTKVSPTAESLRASTSRAQSTTASAPKKAGSLLVSGETSKALCLIILAAVYSPLSQLILSPVFGSIPSAIYHKYVSISSSLLAFALRGLLPYWAERCLPAFAFWIPSIHLAFFSFSTKLGNPWGPLVTELFTIAPLITWSLYMATKVFEDVDLSFLDSETLEQTAPSMVFYLLFTIFERIFRSTLPQLLAGVGFLTSRIGLQLTLSVLYGLLLPKSLFWPAVPSIIVTMTLNVHNPLQRTTDVLNNTLALHHYTLLDRFESVNGYLSVIEDNEKQFRVLRCDHSLLGGQWLDPPTKKPDRKVEEPIYAVFTMMEAVRLVEPPRSQTHQLDTSKKALNIGLGVGTAPSAMIMHGINTTIVEIDPVVHYLAGTYFSLPANHTYYLGDAVGFVEHHATNPTPDSQYDYVLHDVFTGGAVPTSLFTREFLTSLSKLLTPAGTIAINYAGDLNLPSSSMVYATITAVFPNCRIFREDPEPEKDRSLKQDFTNLVYFCTHPGNSEPIIFRKPARADFLGSWARQEYLVLKNEVNGKSRFGDGGTVVSTNDRSSLKELGKWQVESALGHWRLMRTVVPDIVWNNW